MEGGDDGEEEDDDGVENMREEPEITLQALNGWGSSKTMRVMTVINRQQVVALIDSGSMRNFVSEWMANRLNLTITTSKPFNVRVADGFPLHYRQVAVEVGSATFTVDLFALPLIGLYVVLGMQWLEMLGPTMCDWHVQSLWFMWAEKERVVHGLASEGIQQAHSTELAKEIRMGQTLFALSIHEEKHGDDDVSPIDNNLSPLLHTFDGIF